MSNKKESNRNNNIPCLIAYYPQMVAIARKHKCALAVHGSTKRDLDLVLIQWDYGKEKHEKIIKEYCDLMNVSILNSGDKNHLRKFYCIGDPKTAAKEGYFDISCISLDMKKLRKRAKNEKR